MPDNNKLNILHISDQISGLTTMAALKVLTEIFPKQVTFSSSFSMEDQMIAHQILSNQLPISIFTLDTGRLFEETYSVWTSTNEKYQTNIKAFYPNYSLLEEFLNTKGPNAFYESLESRKQCCQIRKVEPLKRALSGQAVWVTGLRAAHSPDRKNLQSLEWDDANQLIKFHPLLWLTTEEIREYIDKNNVPHNILHDKGFLSIGCAPCTRAIKEGEDFRAGRWWWEETGKKECGLHIK
jgi:phosphoadenosine phosphosulfate reductase